MSATDKLNSEVVSFEGADLRPQGVEEADRHAGMARGIMAVGVVWVVAGAIVVAIVLLAASIMHGG